MCVLAKRSIQLAMGIAGSSFTTSHAFLADVAGAGLALSLLLKEHVDAPR